jgi:hypothetical protein
VATPQDFLDLGSRPAVDQSLSRLVKKGLLRRVDRGVYGYPERSALVGELSPAPETVAKALASGGQQRLLPGRAYAANLLGLTEQVPAAVEYLTDGPPRRRKVQRLSVVLKRTTTKNMATADRMTGTLIQALRFLGKDKVGPEAVEILRRRLSPEDKAQLVSDIPLAPAWMASIFRRIAAEGEERLP